MRITALATDFDGTLAHDGRVEPATTRSLERFAATGRRLVLVTGRELDELVRLFPLLRAFDRIVAENGGVLFDPKTRTRRVLGPAPPDAFVAALRRRGVPVAVGATIVATVEPHETNVLEVIRDLGLELQVVFNKGAVMVLPASINKATGLRAALAELGISPRNVAAIGDAENDHAMLRFAEVGVAVANAIPMLKEQADLASGADHGTAVIELVDRILADDLRDVLARNPRRGLLIGTAPGGGEVRVPALGTRLLVAGPGGVGGSGDVAAGVLEGVQADGYQCVVIDAAGVYDRFPNAIGISAGRALDTLAEVMSALDAPEANVLVRLEALGAADRASLARDLMRAAQHRQGRTGRPHCMLVAGLHEVLAHDAAGFSGLLTEGDASVILVATEPERIAPEILAAIDRLLACGSTARATLAALGRRAGDLMPQIEASELQADTALLWSARTPGAPVVVLSPVRRAAGDRSDPEPGSREAGAADGGAVARR